MKALQAVFPDISEEEGPPAGVGRLNYPRPISEPPSPSSTRAHSPVSSAGDQVQPPLVSPLINMAVLFWYLVKCTLM